MKICESCIYFDKLRSKIESKRLKKKVFYCSRLNKTIDKEQFKKMTQCDLYSSSNPG